MAARGTLPGSETRDQKATQRRGWAARAWAAYLLLRGALLLLFLAALFVVVTSLGGAWLEAPWARAGLGALVVLILPWWLQRRLRRAIARAALARAEQAVTLAGRPVRASRNRQDDQGELRPAPRTGRGRVSAVVEPGVGGSWFLVACNGLVLLCLCLGFSDAVGRSLRRRGDWFLGELEGPLPRRYRRLLQTASAWLERFDLPPEARPLLLEAAVYQPEQRELREGVHLPPRPAPPRWVHPLGGPQRSLPPNAACRFGAARPGPRPPECELGHCGIDLVQPEGSPVHAVSDGVVVRVQRDERAGGISGRFVLIAHGGGAVQSTYVHLQEIRSDIKAGSSVRAGEVIATLGRTGCRTSAAHLHFALAVQRGSGQLFIDPEPLVRAWALPGLDRPLLADQPARGPTWTAGLRRSLGRPDQPLPSVNGLPARAGLL